jgi:hypothetical protein
MLELVVRVPFLAFSTPCFAPDEPPFKQATELLELS